MNGRDGRNRRDGQNDQNDRIRDGFNNPHWWLLAFCAGIVALRFFPQLPPPALTVAAGLVLVAGAVGWVWLRPAAAWAGGFCWAVLVATAVSDAALPTHLEKQDVVVSGRVVGAPAVVGGFQRFDFAVDGLTFQGQAQPFPGKIRLKLYRAEPAILSGQRWRFSVRLKRARGYLNPGASFQYETHLFHHRLRAVGYVRERPAPVLLTPQHALSIDAFRQRAAAFIRAALPHSDRAGLVAALVVGIRTDMSPRNWEVLLSTGTIHLVAISGLHIGLVSGLAMLLGGWCWRLVGALPLRLPAPKAGIVAGLLAGLVYALLAGMTIPTQRAVCMLAVVAGALFFQRRPFGWETLVMALAVVLAVDPLAPLAGGLWLSFGAVAVLVLGVARTQAYFRGRPAPKTRASRQLLHKLGAWSVIQLMLFVGMAPLLLALFHRVSLVAPLANLVAVPVIGMLAVPAGLLGLLGYALGLEQAAALAFQSALWVIDQLWVLLEWLSATAWSVWRQPSPPLWSLPLAAVGVLLLLSPRAFPARWSGLLWLLPLFPATPAVPEPGAFRYTMLEVGHGLASVVQTRNHLLVYDAGPRFPSGFDTGETVVVPFLHQLGAGRMDVFMVSHGDNDHFGGQRAVLAGFPADRILTSVPEKIPTAQRCHAGQNWIWDGVRFEVLWPPAPLAPSEQPASPAPQSGRAAWRGNDASCVLSVRSPFGSLLLTGDIGEGAEAALIHSAANLSADVLQIPHHGSKTSSTEGFLGRVRPVVGLVSIGYLNRYGHPHQGVAARYKRRRIPVYRTADEGAISASFEATGIALQGHRSAHRKYWLQPAKQLRAPLRFDPRRQRGRRDEGAKDADKTHAESGYRSPSRAPHSSG